MKEQSPVFTPEGIKRVTAELEQLKAERNEKLRMDPEADLSFLRGRIEEIERMIQNVEETSGPAGVGVIGAGAYVKLRDIEFAEELEYRLVHPYEADPKENKVSVESPMGLALTGKRAGDLVKVEGPGGSLTYEVVAVEY
ncbi:MAG TPA: GreA/GreB family elongation factor [Bacillales bacterium]|nr:GreA/GreB family elongation factor [Bacillales bacterium]HEU5141286.1 GreA/GreB family elongation factor [Bacillales bacterium]